jgi:hypothetical protein
MSQRELESAVAAATGESLQTIRRRGFSVIDPSQLDFDAEPDDLPAQIVDWDAADLRRRAA